MKQDQGPAKQEVDTTPRLKACTEKLASAIKRKHGTGRPTQKTSSFQKHNKGDTGWQLQREWRVNALPPDPPR